MERQSPQTLQFGEYEVRGDVDLLYRGDEVVPLPPRAVRLLRYLADNPDRVVPKDELLDEVWPDVFTTDGVLKKAISQIRRAIGDEPGEGSVVRTYHKRGYRLMTPVRRVQPGERRASGTASSRGIHRELAPSYDQFAGRDAQLATLHGELAQRLERGDGRPVVLRGEAGIGKTRLARHFLERIPDGTMSLYARFHELRGARPDPFQVIFDLLAEAVRVPRRELGRVLAERFGVSVPAELTDDGHLALKETMQDPSRWAVPIARAWLALARDAPVVLVLDDLQWADQASLDVIGALMRLLEYEPLMLLLLVRDENEGIIDKWLTDQALHRAFTMVRLNELDRAACREIIGGVFNVLPSGEIPKRDTDRIFELTGGNPYFLLETLRVLVAEGAVTPDAERNCWVWQGIRHLSLPGSVVMASRARVSRLSPPAIKVIEAASVIGDELRTTTLERLVGASGEDIEALLDEAVRHDVLSISGVPRGDDFRFQHSLLRRVVYDSIPPVRRRRLHAEAARAIELLYAGEIDRMSAALSDHYAEAGDERGSFEASLRGWSWARSRAEWLEALTLVERAQAASEELARRGDLSDGERLDLLLVTGETFVSVGRNQAAIEVLNRASDLAESVRNRHALARALLMKGKSEAALSKYGDARAAFVGALDLFTDTGDEDGSSRAILGLAVVENALGNTAHAADLASRLLASHPAEELEALALGILGWSKALRGELDEGRTHLEQAITYHDRVADPRERATLLRRLHWVHLSRGEYEPAIETAVRAREDSIMIGDIRGEAKANLGIGQARIAQGAYEEGISFLDRTLERLRFSGDSHCEAEARWLIGRAKCELGELDEAATLIERALATVREIGDRDDEFRMLIDLSRTEARRGNPKSAREHAERAEEISRSLGNQEGMALAAARTNSDGSGTEPVG